MKDTAITVTNVIVIVCFYLLNGHTTSTESACQGWLRLVYFPFYLYNLDLSHRDIVRVLKSAIEMKLLIPAADTLPASRYAF